MRSFTSVDFTSRECKTNKHQSCEREWNGFGIIVHCNCVCHKKIAVVSHDLTIQENRHRIEEEALEKVGEPVPNTFSNIQSLSSSNEVGQRR